MDRKKSIDAIEALLNDMMAVNKKQKTGEKYLANTKDTWSRIAKKDSFLELDFKNDQEKEEFLKEWLKENEYQNL